MLDSGHLIFDINPSRQLLLMLISVYGLVFVSIVILYDNNLLKLALLLTVLFVPALLYSLKSINRVQRVIISAAGECSINTSDGHTHEVHLLDGSYCSDWLIVLAFREADLRKTFYTVIARDSVNPAILKQLRTLLKISLFDDDKKQ